MLALTSIWATVLLAAAVALGGSADPVLGRATIRDIYTPREAAKTMAILAASALSALLCYIFLVQ